MPKQATETMTQIPLCISPSDDLPCTCDFCGETERLGDISRLWTTCYGCERMGCKEHVEGLFCSPECERAFDERESKITNSYPF